MPRRRRTAAEYIEERALFVPLVIGDLVEHLGHAAVAWSEAVWAARNGDLDRALEKVVEVEIACDVPLRVSRSEIREITNRAGKMLDVELPDDD